MSSLQAYTDLFFDELEIYEDTARGHHYKTYIRGAVTEFLQNETKKNAFGVYKAFFDSYRITLAGQTNPFADLLDVLLMYEENAATLIEKQRDHYIHSVNVFILGLCVYIRNQNYKRFFNAAVMDKAVYPFSYDTRHEEFFYRWGLASLFHDVGYPVEIIGNQINQFMRFAVRADGDARANAHVEIETFDRLNSVPEVQKKRVFTKGYYDRYEDCVYIDLLKPTDLLAHRLHLALGLDLKELRASLDGFVSVMAKNGFVDHGYYSAIIVLRWYGYLIQSCGYKPEYFYFPVLDSASAVLLHNYYKNVLMKPPFGRGGLEPGEHPVAWLLILCDELQEWNREAYGSVDRKRTGAAGASVSVDNGALGVTYIIKKGALPGDFCARKTELLGELLKTDEVFPGGLSVNCGAAGAAMLPLRQGTRDGEMETRPLLDRLEQLAMAVHALYNQKQRERHPDRPLEYPDFTSLPDSLKYSNLRQAEGVVKKLDLLGCEMRPAGSTGELLKAIPEGSVEALAEFEHEEWMRERIESGWIYGPEKDTEKKISPYIVPYGELSEEIRELDRDAIRNIPELLAVIGMAAYLKNS